VPHLLFRHWLKLLYTFEVLMIVGATIFAKPEVSQFGWTAFGVTAGVNIVAWLLGDFIKGKTPVRRLIVFLFVAVVLILALIGALKTGSFLFGWQIVERRAQNCSPGRRPGFRPAFVVAGPRLREGPQVKLRIAA
jgi:thiol:disulfide interchange protein